MAPPVRAGRELGTALGVRRCRRFGDNLAGIGRVHLRRLGQTRGQRLEDHVPGYLVALEEVLRQHADRTELVHLGAHAGEPGNFKISRVAGVNAVERFTGGHCIAQLAQQIDAGTLDSLLEANNFIANKKRSIN